MHRCQRRPFALYRLTGFDCQRRGNARVEIRVPGPNLPALRQLTRESQFDAVGALHANRNQLIGCRIGRLDVGPLQAKQRCSGRGATVKKIQLGTDLDISGLFRCQLRVVCGERKAFSRRLERLTEGRVIRLIGAWLIDHASAWTEGPVGPVQVGLPGAPLIGRLIEFVVSHTGQRFPMIRQRDQILDIHTGYAQDAKVVGRGGRGDQKRQGRQDWLEERHGCNVVLSAK